VLKDLKRKDDSYGKFTDEFFNRVIYPRLGAKNAAVLVGPAKGVDICVIKMGKDALVVCADPVSLIPKLGVAESAWMSVNLIANDLATSGFKPQYLEVEFNLPPQMSDAIFTEYWNSFSAECSRLGISIVGGHTGRFEGSGYTIIGGATAFALGPVDRYLTSKGARVGDCVILTKGAAISATGLLARMFPNKTKDKIGSSLFGKALSYFQKISATNDAVTAASVGSKKSGVTAIHDVAEGGVFAAVCELAMASSLGLSINEESIPVSAETKAVCELFGLDPYRTLGEGALVVSCSKSRAGEVVHELRQNGIEAEIVGDLLKPEEGLKITHGGIKKSLAHDNEDRYWNAYNRAITRLWD
jgi:hydrogenase expression/formation protein HypE